MTSSITPASLKRLPKDSVAVCAHDAGAASHIAAWLSPLQPQLRLFLAGPAEQLFRARMGSSAGYYTTLDEALVEAEVLISGSGWASDLEHRARQRARVRGIPSVAVLDHWLNYRERFRRNGEELLPDELWVADSVAAELAKTEFPNVPVLQLPNHWLDELCSNVHSKRTLRIGKPRTRFPAKRLLYLLEPIREPWAARKANTLEAGEFQGLRYWLQQLPNLQRLGVIETHKSIEGIRLRPHPSERTGKYSNFISEAQRHWPITLDINKELADSLSWSDAVFGCETQALVAAMSCGIPAFSTMPPWAPKCRIPHSTLNHLRYM